MKTRLPILYRDFDVQLLEREEGSQEPEVGQLARHPFSVSSEYEVERMDWWSGKRYIEILGHDAEEVDKTYLKNGLAVLDRHFGDQVGRFDNYRFDNKKLKGDIRFSRSEQGQDFERDVLDKIRSSVSVGYRVLKFKVVEMRTGDVEVRRITRWMPMEVSLVPIGADPTAQAGRAQSREDLFEVEVETDGETVQEGRTMEPKKETPAATATLEVREPAPAAPQRDFSAEAAEIARLADAHGMNGKAAEWIEKRMTPDQVARTILVEKSTRGNGQPAAEELAKPKDLERYSYSRALQQALVIKEGREPDGIEGEVHRELRKRLPVQWDSKGGILAPMRTGTRALDSKTAGKGLELVQEQPQDMIELLRTRTMVLAMGGRSLTGLTAPISFPKQTGGMTMYWMPENGGTDVTDSDLGTGLVVMTPKTLMGLGKISRQLIAQASVDSEAMVRDELVNADARAFDQAAIHGSGVLGEPTGIYIAPDVNVQAMGGNPDFPKIVKMGTLVASKNADLGSLGYLVTPLMAGYLMSTLEFSAAGSKAIWVGTFRDGVMAGFRAGATNQVKSTLGAGSNEHGMIFGNWSDLVIGFWGGIELTVDPYTLMGQAMLRIGSYHLVDVILRHGESFTKATGATVP